MKILTVPMLLSKCSSTVTRNFLAVKSATISGLNLLVFTPGSEKMRPRIVGGCLVDLP